MTQPVRVDPEELRAFAKRFDGTLAPQLERVRTLLREVSGLESAMFTTVTRPLATVYTLATEYIVADVESKTNDLQQFVDRLTTTASQWAAAEHGNTDIFTPPR
jgi:hypothetical protein